MMQTEWHSHDGQMLLPMLPLIKSPRASQFLLVSSCFFHAMMASPVALSSQSANFEGKVNHTKVTTQTENTTEKLVKVSLLLGLAVFCVKQCVSLDSRI